jgi:LmbE family N-acetylglucosaminyl deacetylase
MKSMLIAAFLMFTLSAVAQNVRHTFDPSMFRAGYDIPAGVVHGTWDFDEWPGVDHKVVYVKDFMYGDGGNEKIKIDYTLSVFDSDDHTGYLRAPQVLAERFADMSQVLDQAVTIMVLTSHPDDELLLAGGLISAAASKGKNVKVYLISNGADGSMGFDENPDPSLGGYNSAGVMPDGSERVGTDLMGLQKQGIARRYGLALGVDINILPVRYQMNGKQVVQIGEYAGFDFKKSFGPGTIMRGAIQRSIEEVILRERPDVVITHGTDGEYGNYLHKTMNVIIKSAVLKAKNSFKCTLFTAFPEYNFNDHITHFLDLDANGGQSRNSKHNALKGVTYVYKPGTDYDKPWNPKDDLMDGAFVKDYGYAPTDGKPPRYEFFQKVD